MHTKIENIERVKQAYDAKVKIPEYNMLYSEYLLSTNQMKAKDEKFFESHLNSYLTKNGYCASGQQSCIWIIEKNLQKDFFKHVRKRLKQ